MAAKRRNQGAPRGNATIRRTVRVPALARVEGEGALYLKVEDGRVREVRLDIYEPPRFFEALLRGRAYTEPPDITARICGICPVAYQVSACNALEDACGVVLPPSLRDLRRLLYCGEWIQSHALHIYLLHAPDFLGYQGVTDMAKDHGAAVQRGLALKKVGNELMTLLGGRAVHPVNVRVGGFYRLPDPDALLALAPQLERARELAIETVRWVADFDFPAYDGDYELVALRDEERYPLEGGRLLSDRGLDITPDSFETHVEELQVPHSTALHAAIRGRGAYLVGPLARYSLNADRLSPLAREVAEEAGLGSSCRNPFRSIVVRAVEVVYACDEALRLIRAYEPPEAAAVEVAPRAARGHGWSEAPRGLLYHRYTLDEAGLVRDARIVPPTSQNQASIETDVARVAEQSLALDREALSWRCEQAIRNHDPCISCATHFLRLDLDREEQLQRRGARSERDREARQEGRPCR